MEDKLMEMLKECSNHHRDKNSLLKYVVNRRLNESLKTYYHEIEMSTEYLSRRKVESVVNKF